MRGMLRSMKETLAHISCLRHASRELSCGRYRAIPMTAHRDSRRARLAAAFAKGSSEPFRAEVST